MPGECRNGGGGGGTASYVGVRVGNEDRERIGGREVTEPGATPE